ncbi:MAG TPA: GNAT family N-acetyltransferase [Pyrinomonadaceae bacterium]|jgi:predicted GNAT superfamily acetyltransferase|nr:GNAT family N-acetyltransferase [Pyrinomonadaceae bacterium]
MDERDAVEIRECVTVEEFDACVVLQREGFGLPDLELSPRRHLIVARSAGGYTLGAFDGARLVGFVLTQVAVRGGSEVIGYSHMMAVARDQQNRGVGARLKWAQRERALREGRRFILWTWDPVQSRNAHFNLNRLGVVARRYAENYYGTDYSTVTGKFGERLGLDSDRLVAEWELDSPRVEAFARGERPEELGEPEASVEIPPDWGSLVREDAARAREELLRVRNEFEAALARGLHCAAFRREGARPRYLFYGDE